jgi:beta-phosphoglucomutase
MLLFFVASFRVKQEMTKIEIMNKKAFIFDLDGVIVTRLNTIIWQKIANELNIEFTLEHNELLKGVSRALLDIILELEK